MPKKHLKCVTNDYIQGEGYLQEEEYSGTRKVWWNDEDYGMQVSDQPVPRFNPLKHSHFYRYLTPGFMKQYKNYIKLYNTIVQLISKGCN